MYLCMCVLCVLLYIYKIVHFKHNFYAFLYFSLQFHVCNLQQKQQQFFQFLSHFFFFHLLYFLIINLQN